MTRVIRVVLASGIIGLIFGSALAEDEGFVSIFDGQTLDGWDGDPKFWSVQDGAITGQTTQENPTAGNTFIIWRKGLTKDFELKLDYRIVRGNSGIQYRSFEAEVTDKKWVVGGYQADIEDGDTWSGALYGERYRGILARRGERTIIGNDHKRNVVGQVGDSDELQSLIKKEEWNEYHISARGFHLVHKINGHVTAEVTDQDKEIRRDSGILALQLHTGPPMRVQFRNIRLKTLERVQEPAEAGEVAGVPASHDPDVAVAGLEVHDQLECTLFASEPMMLSPSAMDIDLHGRVWVCEIVNYRRNARSEGDSILILEDTDQDGRADKRTIFYQGPDINSPHGVCVLDTPEGKNKDVYVSTYDKILVLSDKNGDDKPDSKTVLFRAGPGANHDHGLHAVVAGPDGKLYFAMGNAVSQLLDRDGKRVVDRAGNEVVSERKPYQQGMVFRCNQDGSELETLGWNFRNNWMPAVDSFGTIWQSDNDDDGNRGVRINYIMEFGNYGFQDELTGAPWQTERTGWHPEIAFRHWHQNDPGVVPNVLHTGAGSPAGITVYEGQLLPEIFHGQLIHCDPGPNVVRAYPLTSDGAGYRAGVINILHGARDNWFRPVDVKVAPDGSLFVADWYDPGVGGHKAGDLTRGRLFRVAPQRAGDRYVVPQFDFSSAASAAEALTNPNNAARYVAWSALRAMGAGAEEELQHLLGSDNPRHRARALWLLARIDGKGDNYVALALSDKDPDIRITGLRLARRVHSDVLSVVKSLIGDPSPAVRRECAIALAGRHSSESAELWAELASQHDGQDRWYLEALGIAARGHWDVCFSAWLRKVGDDWNTPAGRDIIWRSRSAQAPKLLAEIIKDPATPDADKPRYFRAFDFHDGPEKEEALRSILGL